MSEHTVMIGREITDQAAMRRENPEHGYDHEETGRILRSRFSGAKAAIEHRAQEHYDERSNGHEGDPGKLYPDML
jgi:hypothetical protein